MKTAYQNSSSDSRVTRDSDARNVTLDHLEEQISQIESQVEQALHSMDVPGTLPPEKPATVTVWGVPFSRLTMKQTLHHIDALIRHGEPGYFITANLNYNMLTAQYPALDAVNDKASFIICDGMPILWRSKLTDGPLPERVAGSEMIYALTKWAAHKQYRVFFLGGAPGVAQAAAEKLRDRYPGLIVAGIESPPFRPLTDQEDAELVSRVAAARPDIIYVALGQPKGEVWLAKHYQALGAPISVQIGASFDFVAGGVIRAPQWVQRMGMEWFYRMLQEPQRLAGRYLNNAVYLMQVLYSDVRRLFR